VALCSGPTQEQLCRLHKSKCGANWEYVEKKFALAKDASVRIKIVDNARGDWGHFAVDQVDIRQGLWD